jgi:hypothetical protein
MTQIFDEAFEILFQLPFCVGPCVVGYQLKTKAKDATINSDWLWQVFQISH